MLLAWSMVLTGIIMTLLTLSPLLGGKQFGEYEKNSPFECGFDPLGVGHLNFSVRFFLIAVIFLIFDVEIALLLPLVVTKLSIYYSIWGFLCVVFMLILGMGTFYEWKEGALDWKV